MKVPALAATLSLFFSTAVFAQTPATYLTTELRHPESIISDGRYYYVSDIGAKMEPDTKDGDGAIVKLSLDGKVLSKNIVRTPIHAPKGSAIIKGLLYVADIDRIRVIQLSSGKQLSEIDFSAFKANFLNDIVAKDDHTLFVTSSDLGKVFEVRLKGRPVIKDLGISLAMTNGLAYSKRTGELYINSMGAQGNGEIGVIRRQGGKAVYKRIGPDAGIFDGIALLGKQTLLVSDWASFDQVAGVLKQVDITSGQVKPLTIPVIAGPADFYYHAARKQVLVPVMLEGKIQVVSL